MSSPVAVSANLLNGRPVREVRHGVDMHLGLGAQVVAFEEAGGYLPIIRDLRVEHGYRAPIAAKATAGKGMNSSVLLVHRDVPVYASGVALVSCQWIGPRLGVRWPGRGIPWAVTELDWGLGRERVLVAAIHGPTGRNGVNKLAWRRYLRRLRRMARKKARKHGATRVLYLGDWNCPDSAKDARSVRRLVADRLGLKVVKTGTRPPIDYAVTDLPLVGVGGPAYGSDHRSTRFYWKASA